MPDRLRVIVMTQADRFFIPKNIDKAAAVCELLEIVEVDCKGSLENKLGDYYKWFGFWQCAKMGAATLGRECEKYLDRLTKYRLFHGDCSVRDAAIFSMSGSSGPTSSSPIPRRRSSSRSF